MELQAMTGVIAELEAQISGALRPLQALEERERVRLETLEERERARGQAPVPPPEAPVKLDLRCPTFDGGSEVEDFVEQFLGIAQLAQWPAEVRLFRLRTALQGRAQNLGQGPNEDRIIASLRLRYGLMPTEARGRLEVMRREPQVSLQEHATVIEKMARVAFTGLPEAHELQLTKERFLGSLGTPGLRRHLLGIPTHTIKVALRAGNEYLQLSATHTGPLPAVLTR